MKKKTKVLQKIPNKRGIGPTYNAARLIEEQHISLEQAAKQCQVSILSVIRTIRAQGRRIG